MVSDSNIGDGFSYSSSSPLHNKDKPSSESQNKSLNTEAEKTEIWYGQDKAMMGLVRSMSKIKSRADVVGDSLAPSFSMGVEQIKKGYVDFKKRNVKIRFITEITIENLPYCKELMQYTELRHMDGVKGNMAISETEYVATANLEGEAKPVTQTIYSNAKAILEQHKYFFENLWSKAIPAEERIKEIEEGIEPEVIETIKDPIRLQNMVFKILKAANKEIQGIFSTANAFHRQEQIGGFTILKDIYDGNPQLRIRISYP